MKESHIYSLSTLEKGWDKKKVGRWVRAYCVTKQLVQLREHLVYFSFLTDKQKIFQPIDLNIYILLSYILEPPPPTKKLINGTDKQATERKFSNTPGLVQDWTKSLQSLDGALRSMSPLALALQLLCQKAHAFGQAQTNTRNGMGKSSSASVFSSQQTCSENSPPRYPYLPFPYHVKQTMWDGSQSICALQHDLI